MCLLLLTLCVTIAASDKQCTEMMRNACQPLRRVDTRATPLTGPSCTLAVARLPAAGEAPHVAAVGYKRHGAGRGI